MRGKQVRGRAFLIQTGQDRENCPIRLEEIAATAPNVLDTAIGRALQNPTSTQSQPGGVLDAAIARALGAKPPAAPPDMTYAGNAFPQLARDEQSRTLYNMMAAQSGQKLATPEDQAIGEQGKAAGFISAGVTAAGGTLASLFAPSVATATAGTGVLNPAGEEILKDVTQYGPSLIRQALGNPVVQHLLGRTVGYGTLGYILRRVFSGQQL